MNLINQLIHPLSLLDFRRIHIEPKKPYAGPNKVRIQSPFNPWKMIGDLLAIHDNCWLPQNGRLPNEAELNSGRLRLKSAQNAFSQGRTVLIRQAQKSHLMAKSMTDQFENCFGGTVDLQIYYTPAGQEGFDWHYDAEEVFILQIQGEKEFFLRKNTINPSPSYHHMPKNLRYETETSPEIFRCHLVPGDFLYIPAGYWHKATALNQDSFHFSIGILSH